jgi:hypothetical protein
VTDHTAALMTMLDAPAARSLGDNRAVSLTLTGDKPFGQVLFQLPAFVRNLDHSGLGTFDDRTGTVTLPPNARHMTVKLVHHI